MVNSETGRRQTHLPQGRRLDPDIQSKKSSSISTPELLPDDDLASLAPIPEDREIRVDRIQGILTCHGKQNARSADNGPFLLPEQFALEQPATD